MHTQIDELAVDRSKEADLVRRAAFAAIRAFALRASPRATRCGKLQVYARVATVMLLDTPPSEDTSDFVVTLTTGEHVIIEVKGRTGRVNARSTPDASWVLARNAQLGFQIQVLEHASQFLDAEAILPGLFDAAWLEDSLVGLRYSALAWFGVTEDLRLGTLLPALRRIRICCRRKPVTFRRSGGGSALLEWLRRRPPAAMPRAALDSAPINDSELMNWAA